MAEDGEILPNLGADGTFQSDPLSLEQSAQVGLTIADAIQQLGTPVSMYSMRGSQEWQDDVVFFYSDYRYLYWYENRVWQVRYDYRSTQQFAGAMMGMTRDEAREVLGEPHYVSAESDYYDLPDIGYPLRSRFYYKDGILYDIYMYRSDF